MKKSIVLASTLLLTSFSSIAAEAPAVSKTCIGCHGADGNSMVPNFPKLAGQHAAYLEKALKDYKTGQRKDPTMQAFAKGLTDEQIKELAQYYASQKAK